MEDTTTQDKTVQLNVRVPRRLKRTLRAQVRREKRRLGLIVADALRLYLDRYETERGAVAPR